MSFYSLRAPGPPDDDRPGVRPPLERVATRRVREMIVCRRDLRVDDLVVEVRQGCAVLHGTVAREADAEEAARIASAVVGVTAVDSRLSVRPARADASARNERPPESARVAGA